MNRSCQGGTRAKFCFHMVKNLIVECDLSTSKTADTVHTGGYFLNLLLVRLLVFMGCLYLWGGNKYIYIPPPILSQ